MRLPVFPSIVILLTTLAALAVLPLVAPLSPNRGNLETLIDAYIGQPVRIAGHVELRLLPRPRLFFHDLKLVETPPKSVLKSVYVKRAIIDLSWRGILEWRLAIGRLTLQDVQIDADFEGDTRWLSGWLSDAKFPSIDIRRANLSFTGLSSVDRARRLQLEHLDAHLGAATLEASRRLRVQHLPQNSAATRLDLQLGVGSERMSVDLKVKSDDGDGLRFNGFIRPGEAWRADGEVSLSSRANLAMTLASAYGLEVAPNGKNLQLSGLVRLNRHKIVSDNLQLLALGGRFQTRLSLQWPNSQIQTPTVEARFSTGIVDFSNLQWRSSNLQWRSAPPNTLSPSAEAPKLAEPARLLPVWATALEGTTGRFRLEADRFGFGGETGRNLLVSLGSESDRLRIERLSADLPFNSSILGAGDFLYGKKGSLDLDGPSFEGSFSARSSDTLGMSIWLGGLIDHDVSGFIENVDEARVQRTSFVTDIAWSPRQLAFQGLSGRLGDDRFRLDLVWPFEAQKDIGVTLQMERFDFADWGLARSNNNNNLGFVSLLPNLDMNRLLSLANLEGAPRYYDLSLSLDRLYADVRNMGPVSFKGRAGQNQLHIEQMILSNYDGANVQLVGDLSHDGTQSYGNIDLALTAEKAQTLLAPLIGHLSPLAVDLQAPLTLNAGWLLSARDAPDWPNVSLKGEGALAGLGLVFEVTTPDRRLDFGVPGSQVNFALSGEANDLALRLGMLAQFGADAKGDLTIQAEAQAGAVVSVQAGVGIHTGGFRLNGNIQPHSSGRRLEGRLDARGQNFLPLLGRGDYSGLNLAFDGRTQISVTKDSVSFSGLSGTLAQAEVSGEGLYTLGPDTGLLSANLFFDGFDGSAFLPGFEVETGWSNEPMNWALLGRSDADLDLRFRQLKLGRLPIETARGTFKLRDGVVEAPALRIQALGAEILADLQAEGGDLTPLFNLSARVSDLQMAAAFEAFYDQPILTADVDGTLTMRGRGRSAKEMVASLQGAANFEASPGELTFFDLPAMQALRGPQADERGGDFERGLGAFTWRDGILETGITEFVFASPQHEAELTSKFNAVTRKLNLDFEERLGLAESEDSASQPVRLQVTGDLAKPQVIVGPQTPISTPIPTPIATPALVEGSMDRRVESPIERRDPQSAR